jgi:hypothetical protein
MGKHLAVLLLFAAASGFEAGLLLDKNQHVDPAHWNDYSIEELVLYRNSLFARYGYIFKSGALTGHFHSLGWYRPNNGFSYLLLSKIDRQNINAILAVEKRKVNDLKNNIAGTKIKTKRYYMTARARDRVPAAAEGEMKKWWRKKLGETLFPQLRVPVMLAVTLADEKDPAFIKGRTGDTSSCWEAGYDGKGLLRVLKNCLCGQGGSGDCGDVYYFDDRGRLLMVRGGIPGITVNYVYYYQYCLDSVVWIEVALINGSAGIPDETEKFF